MQARTVGTMSYESSSAIGVERLEVSVALRLVGGLIRRYRALPIKPFRSSLRAVFSRYQQLYRGKQLIAEVEGFKYEIDVDEMIDRAILFDGAFEPVTANALKRLAPRGATVLDIGANIGCHTCLLAKLVHPGKVIAFEPMPWARRKLLRNIALNGFENVIVESYALSDGKVPAMPTHFRSSWQMDSRTGQTGENSVSCSPAVVDFITLDSYVAENSIGDIGLIKLDVDGYEAKILRGAAETLRKFRPILVMEFCAYTLEAAGDGLPDVIDLLDAVGYKICREDNFLEFTTRKEILESVPAGSSINVVCSCEPVVKCRAMGKNTRALRGRSHS